MTTIRLKFRPSSVEGRPGTIYYQLCHKQTIKRINTRIHIYPHQWDPVTEQFLISSDELGVMTRYRSTVSRDMQLLHDIAYRMEASGKDYTLEELAVRFLSVHTDVRTLPYMEEDIASLIRDMKLGTASNRRKTLRSFLTFLGHRNIPMSEWDHLLITEYGAWLRRRNLTRNTVSFYMRSLRSVYNKAVKEGLIIQSYPFRNVYTGVDNTRKRAVNEDILLRMKQLDLSRSRPLDLARDIFVFSYCTRGMAFVDIAMLRRRDIMDGCIHYTRKKTGQKMRVRIEPCAREIIDKYAVLNPGSAYIFPLIKSEDSRDIYRQYQTALGYHNRKLKRLSAMLGIDTPLTSYVARHTWATTARNHNTPLAVISSGMGHTSERTTRIYIASLDENVIDRFNRDILAPLNKASKIFPEQ